MDALDLMLKADDLVAVLGRQVPVRLIEISGCGCLLECAGRLEPGTAGLLSVVFDNEPYSDDVRVMRCRESEGGCYKVGAEFLWTRNPKERSLRRILARLKGGAVKATWSEPGSTM
jgi:hypothetical protein